MSLEEMKETQCMKEEDEPTAIRRMAHDWWNWDIPPREGYAQQVHDYIRDHPNEFRGAVAQ